MSEVEIELKDEELLDFDGSDYEFDDGVEEEEIDHASVNPERSNNNRKDAENGEIQEKELDRRASAAAGTSDKNPNSSTMTTTTISKPRYKTDLEDGELSDMVNSKKQTEHGGAKDVVRHSRKHSSDTMQRDREDERNGESRQQRKRRKEHEYNYERYDYISSRDRKESYDRHASAGRYDRSERRHDRFGAFPDPRTRGRNNTSHAQSFHPNLSPGIMGPGRPLAPDVNYPHAIRPSTAGLEIFTPAQLQELLNQEHMLRAQHMLRLGIRPPPGVYPFVGAPNFLRTSLPSGFMGAPLPGPRPGFPSPGAGILGRAQDNGIDEMTGRAPVARDTPDHKMHQSHQSSSRPRSNNKPEAPPPLHQARRNEDSRHHHHHHARRNEDSHHHHRQSERESREQREQQRERESYENKRFSSGNTSAGGGNKSNDYSGNVINLGGPVQKSRVLIVSGLVENTPMSTVADVFEKQGKILDFRKNQRGDVFTITYSSVQEALSAKRHLHRSILAGRQITVEYAV